MEVLSPAGDLKTAKIACLSGADAVYFGGAMYGARASAKNFSLPEIQSLLEYAHVRKKKAYITVNTLLKNTESERALYDFMKPVYETGVDGVIIQDFGVLELLKQHFPGLALHASTQMNLSSAYGARFLKAYGAERIVTAREISLTEIAEIHKNVDIEIETFVHGALCMCYSGLCLMSSFIGGRSGNRGRCAQPCRQSYVACDENKKPIRAKEQYYLSPKDLCGIRDLPKLFEAGVDSLKIEGRLKNEAYVSNVTAIYRYYVDLLDEDVPFVVSDRDIQLLLDAGNRGGFTNAYYHVHNSADMMSLSDGSFHQNLKETNDVILQEKRTALYGEFSARSGEPTSFTIWDDQGRTCTVYGDEPQKAMTKATTRDEVEEKLNAFKELPFAFIHLSVDLEDGLFLPMKQVKQMRRDALAQYSEVPDQKREATPFSPCRPKADPAGEVLCASVETEEQLSAVRGFETVTDLILKENFLYRTNLKESIDSLKKNCRIYLSLPVILRSKTAEEILPVIKGVVHRIDGVYVSSYDGLGFLEDLGLPKEKVFFDERLYAYSDRAVYAFEQAGYHHLFMPLELNEGELSHRMNQSSEALIYGYVPLMYTANCLKKNTGGCQKGDNKLLFLKDKKQAAFPVKNRCRDCVNVLYNCLPLCLFDCKDSLYAMGVRRFRLSFTIEDAKTTKEILKACEAFAKEKKPLGSREFTRGHFRRGVE